jgi:hypothetical protein
MSIFATNWIVDEETGEAKIVKHLNKIRIDRYTPHRVGGWNKSGKRIRVQKRSSRHGKDLRMTPIVIPVKD